MNNTADTITYITMTYLIHVYNDNEMYGKQTETKDSSINTSLIYKCPKMVWTQIVIKMA